MTKMRNAAFALLLAALPALAAPAMAAPAKAAPATPVNINTATQPQLEALPGIGPATAKKIIANRPYASVADLAKAGVSGKTLQQITPLVTVGAPAAPAPAPVAAPAPAPAKPAPAPKTTASTMPAQTPTSPGMVWANPDTKVFHREGDRWYGRTKNGKWMTEADAVKAGYREARPGAVKKAKP